MKACPYCAELIQDRAAKCRYCGEWLDPSKRPPWTESRGVAMVPPPAAAAAVVPAAVAPAPARPAAVPPVRPRREATPDTTVTDGSVGPAERPVQSWSTPPWLAERTEGSEGSEGDPATTPPAPVSAPPTTPTGGTVVSATQPAPSRPPPSPARPTAPTGLAAVVTKTIVSPADAEVPVPTPPASLEDVELEMRRFGGGPPREAIERGPLADEQPLSIPSHPEPAPVVRGDFDDEDLIDALEPRPATRAFEDAILGDLDDEGDEDGEDGAWGDDDFAGMGAARRPLPWIPILGGAALLVAIGAFIFRDALLGTSDDAADAGATTGEVAAADGDAKAPDAKAPDAKAPDAKAPDAKAPDAKADAKADGGAEPVADGGDAPADGGEPPVADGGAPPAVDDGTPPPAAPPAGKLDAATMAKLEEARALYTRAEGRNRKLLAQAGEILTEVLAAAPNHAEALLLQAQVQLESGNGDEALVTARRCTAASAELADCWLTIGILEQDRKHKEEAAAAYEKYVSLAPDGKYAADVKKQLKFLTK